MVDERMEELKRRTNALPEWLRPLAEKYTSEKRYYPSPVFEFPIMSAELADKVIELRSRIDKLCGHWLYQGSPCLVTEEDGIMRLDFGRDCPDRFIPYQRFEDGVLGGDHWVKVKDAEWV